MSVVAVTRGYNHGLEPRAMVTGERAHHVERSALLRDGGGGHGSGGGEGCRMTVPAAKSGEAWRAVSIRRACSAQLSHCDCDYDYCYYCYYCYYYYCHYLLLPGSSPTSYYYYCLLPAARSSVAPRRCPRC